MLRKHADEPKGNQQNILQFAGILTDAEAKQLKKEITSEFSIIEGDW